MTLADRIAELERMSDAIPTTMRDWRVDITDVVYKRIESMIEALLLTDDELAGLLAQYEGIVAEGGLGSLSTSFMLVCETARRSTLSGHRRLAEEEERMALRGTR